MLNGPIISQLGQSSQSTPSTQSPQNTTKVETDETAKSDSSDGASDDGQCKLSPINVTEQNLDEAYAQFTDTCNPSVPLMLGTTDPSEMFGALEKNNVSPEEPDPMKTRMAKGSTAVSRSTMSTWTEPEVLRAQGQDQRYCEHMVRLEGCAGRHKNSFNKTINTHEDSWSFS